MTKQIITVLGIAVVIFLVLVATQFPPLWSLMSTRAPRPEITHGEFAFRLEYEIHGERVVIEDIVIVEYGGTSWNAGFGNYNVWNSRLESENYLIELYKSDTEIVFINILRHLRGGYLLGREEVNINSNEINIELPTVVRVRLDDERLSIAQESEVVHFFSDDDQRPDLNLFGGGTGSVGRITEEELLSVYGIQLIKFEHDPPIANSFR